MLLFIYKCYFMKKLTTEDIIKRAKLKYGEKYDYSKISYVNYNTKITIICKKHGEFKIRPDHFFEGCGCQKCSIENVSEKQRLSKNDFVKRSNAVHNNKYNYDKVEYRNARKKVCIICPKHGEFWQEPDAHLRGSGCPKCNTFKNDKYTTEEFVRKAKEIHGDKYDYSKVEYINRLTPVCIICPIHGEFWQKPREHFKGQGCQMCNESKLENEIKILLEENNINYESQKKFRWLKNKYPMSLDFFLPEYNVAIECQGEQHFKDRDFFKNYTFEERLKMDILKLQLCEENGVKILYFSKKYFVPSEWNLYNVICNKLKLIKEIKNFK